MDLALTEAVLDHFASPKLKGELRKEHILSRLELPVVVFGKREGLRDVSCPVPPYTGLQLIYVRIRPRRSHNL
jgi:hypothetical protein